MLVAGVIHLHAVDLRHRSRPMHVAVTHQVEHGIDALAREGLGQHFVDRQIAHFFILVLPNARVPGY